MNKVYAIPVKAPSLIIKKIFTNRWFKENIKAIVTKTEFKTNWFRNYLNPLLIKFKLLELFANSLLEFQPIKSR